MAEKLSTQTMRESFEQKYETVLIDGPYRDASLSEDLLAEIEKGKGYLFVSDSEVKGEGVKRRQVYSRRLFEYVIGGALNYSLAFDGSNSTITASVCDSKKPTNIVYKGSYYSEAMEAIDKAGI